MIGTSTVTVTLRGDADENKLTQFVFAGTPLVTRNSTVAFQFHVLSNPNNAKLRFNVGTGGPHSTCPVVETNDAGGTLSTFRRQGCGIHDSRAGHDRDGRSATARVTSRDLRYVGTFQ